MPKLIELAPELPQAVSRLGCLAIILSLYRYKWLLSKLAGDGFRWKAFAFYLGTVVAVPYVWFFSSDWTNPQMTEAYKWAGTPIAVLTVPAISFVIDELRKNESRKCRRIRVVAEIVFGVPIWCFIWGLIAVFFLEWIWI